MKTALTFLLLLAVGATTVTMAGQVVLTSDPTGATIMAGSKPLGVTPLAVDLPAGAVELTSRFGSLEPVVQTVNSEDGQVSAYNFKHSYGTVIIRSDRADATVTMDGADCGRGTALVFVAPGIHKVFARASEAGERSQEVNVGESQRTSVKIQFNGVQEESVASSITPPGLVTLSKAPSSPKTSGPQSVSLVNATAKSSPAPQWEEPPSQLASATPEPSPVASPSGSPNQQTSIQTASKPKASRSLAYKRSKPAAEENSVVESPDPGKAKQLLETEWKAKNEALAVERRRIDYGIRNSTGAVHEEWKYKLALWKLEKKQAEQERALRTNQTTPKPKVALTTTPSTSADPSKVKVLLETERKAKNNALAAERHRIDYELKNSTGQERKQWESKLIAWQREKAKEEQDEAVAKAALKNAH
jgi:PEGA domain